jgi:hypothetical protein
MITFKFQNAFQLTRQISQQITAFSSDRHPVPESHSLLFVAQTSHVARNRLLTTNDVKDVRRLQVSALPQGDRTFSMF